MYKEGFSEVVIDIISTILNQLCKNQEDLPVPVHRINEHLCSSLFSSHRN